MMVAPWLSDQLLTLEIRRSVNTFLQKSNPPYTRRLSLFSGLILSDHLKNAVCNTCYFQQPVSGTREAETEARRDSGHGPTTETMAVTT